MGILKPSCIQIAIALLPFVVAHSKISIVEASAVSKDMTKSCISSEHSALLAFRAGLLDPMNRLSSWEADNCCQWKGVQCSNITGHVVKLDLQAPGCRDNDVSRQPLGGNMSFSVTSLRHLQFLDLSCNMFDMVPIPEFLGSMHTLRYLDLSHSNFVGRIPPQLGNLSNLHYLNLDSYTGGEEDPNIYSMDITWLSRLRSLKHLNMRAVNLSTAANWVSVVNMLPSLQFLYLSHCQLSTSPDSLLHSNLTSLQTLDISYNSIYKPIEPNWFWDLTSLKELYIHSNQFYGPFPYGIGNMTSMVNLSLAMNSLVGMIPSSMKNLCNLEELYLTANNINGSITEFIHRLPSCSSHKLKSLSLCDTNLTGSLPNGLPQRLSNLVMVDLRWNNLIGTVPLWIGNLTKLQGLGLSFNKLDGVIHEGHLSGLPNLEFLLLAHNSLSIILNSTWVPPFNLDTIELGSCHLGPTFPMWLKWQTSAHIIDISNTSISDMVPDWFWVTASSVIILDMRNNQISGFLPSKLEFPKANAIDLSSNQLSGTIPELPVYLTRLDLSRNNVSGPLPLDFGAPGLLTLLLYKNSISGSIPSSLCKLRQLQLVDLSDNKLTGSIPDCVEDKSTINMANWSIQSLNLKNNSLSGEFPLFLRNCQQLVYLDLSQNLFSGILPAWIGEDLPSLAFLRLRYNMFYGCIPVELTNMVKLQYLDLAYNNLTGSLPKSLVHCKGMILIQDKDGEFENIIHSAYPVDADQMIEYTETSTIVMKGQERLYTGEIIYMVNLDLSCNNLFGEIPQEISTLVELKNLNLSWNSFTGKIPPNIGALVQVESLDLSCNKLSGEIPTSLSALTSLSHLNLSYNNLSGTIPSGSQLQVLDDQASIYIGNPGLCGPPISKKCPETRLIPAAPRDKKDATGSDNVFLCVATMSGYVMGLWTVFFVFLFKAKWRIASFRFYDGLFDWV
ncbi:unnamed protein product [Urochloa decumbens]|uniref:Leucine-rich repeat-containing N-terminal plant-type domain-containing protein n=1 Tax=Urochloa decumbens TaxID=240449 RepID=A0ABC9EXH3_9POAL